MWIDPHLIIDIDIVTNNNQLQSVRPSPSSLVTGAKAHVGVRRDILTAS
jgi:hypothetical protein